MIFLETNGKSTVKIGEPISQQQAETFYKEGFIDLIISGNGKSVLIPAWHSGETQKATNTVVKNGKEKITGNKVDLQNFNNLLNDVKKELGNNLTFSTASPSTNITQKNEISDDDSKERITGVAYKLFQVKKGKLYPPMVRNPEGVDTPIGKWIGCGVEEFTEISSSWGKPQASKKKLAYRPGWHLGELPYAPQFESKKNKGYLSKPNFVWARCLYNATTDYNDKAKSYGFTYKGNYRHSAAGLPYIPDSGYYKYRTNPNPNTIAWVITGEMKVEKVLDDAEVEQICRENNVPYLKRPGGDKTVKELGINESLQEESSDFIPHKFNQDVVDYDSRGWILPSGEIISTNNKPHYTRGGEWEDYNTTIKFNFGYERYICLPMRKYGVTNEQLDTLLHLLDYWFIDGNSVGERSRNIELAFIIPGSLFDVISISPKDYTSDEVLKKIKRYYASGVLYEDLNEDLEMSNEYDSKGNQLTKAQAEFFKDSVIRDSKRRLFVCYHNTPNEFKVFDTSFIGTGFGLSFGKGFYFTNDEYIIGDYTGDYQLECYLNIKKPFEYWTDDVDLIKNLIMNSGYDYDKDELDTLIEEYDAYEDDLLEDIIFELFDEPYEAFDVMLKKAGYDGIEAGEEFVAFYPNQIKEITNKTPTDSGNINESLKRVEGNVYATYNVNDVLDRLKTTNKMTRVLYDANLGLFLLSDGDNIHSQMTDIAFDNGYYDEIYDELLLPCERWLEENKDWSYMGVMDVYYDAFLDGWFLSDSGVMYPLRPKSESGKYLDPSLTLLVFIPYDCKDCDYHLGYDGYNKQVNTDIGTILCRTELGVPFEKCPLYSVVDVIDSNEIDTEMCESLKHSTIKESKKMSKTLKENLQSKVDSLGNELSEQQFNYFKQSKVTDSKGNLLVVYHGTPTPGFKEFGLERPENYKFSGYNVNFFTSDKEVARGYTYIGVEEDNNIYACYLDIRTPYIVDNKTKDEIKGWRNIRDNNLKSRELQFADRVWELMGRYIGPAHINEVNRLLKPLGMAIKPSKDRPSEYDDCGYGKFSGEYDLYYGNNIEEFSYPFNEYFEDPDEYPCLTLCDLLKNVEDVDEIKSTNTTNDIVRLVISMNEEDGTNYDGIIIKDIGDNGPTGDMFAPNSDIYITLKSGNQIKSIDNKNPTESNRIDEEKQKTITAYHGSQDGNLELKEEPIYLTNDLELAEQFAMGYAFNFDLLDSDDPTVYEIEVNMNNPLYIKTEDEYDEIMDIVNIEETKQFLTENNYDGIIYQDEYDSDLIYYMPLNAKKQCNIVDEEILESYIPERDDAEVEAQQLSTYEAFMNLKGEDDE